MKCLYIKNYLLTSRDTKLEFIKYLHSFKRFKIEHQKIILNDNSLILELNENSSIKIAKKSIEFFFKKIKKIQVYVIDGIVLKDSKVEIYKENKLFKRVDIS